MDHFPFVGRLMGRNKGSTGPDDAATQLHTLLGAVVPDAVSKYVASLPPQEQHNSSFVAPVLLDKNFTRQVITLLNEFDQWNKEKTNPQFGEHVSWIIGGLLAAVRELDVGKLQDREAGMKFLNEVVSQISDSIFHSPSPDEAMVRAKDDTIMTSLKVLQQDDPSLFDLILRLLSSRCSSSALLQRTFLTPQRELQLQILHLTLQFQKGIQNENQLVYAWNNFVQDQFFSRSSSMLLVDFFNKPPVLYKQLSAKMPPKVSLSVLQGAVKLFERELRGADRESAEATRDLVVKNIYWICPGGFSIPTGNTEGIRDLSKYYQDLLNLTCPSLRQGETGNAQRMGLWWYWLEWVTLAAGLEDLPQKQCLTAPFLERTLQYGLEAVRSTLSEDTLKFFDASVAHFFQTTPPSTFAELKQIPTKFLELKLLQSVLEKNALVWESHQIGWVLDKYAQLLVSRHNFNPQSGDPRVKFLPLHDLLYKSFRCNFINIVPFIRVSLYCPEYSNLFSFEDDRDIMVLKDIMKDVDVKPIARQFPNTVKSLFQAEMEKPDQSQSPLFLLMLKTFACLVVSAETPPGKSISAQLCALGGWLERHLPNLSKRERESSFIIAVLNESVCPRCMMAVEEVMKLTPAVLSLLRFRDLHLDHPFFGNYETGCQQLCDTIREQVDRICDNRVTLQEVKDFAGDQLPPVTPSNTPNPPSKAPGGGAPVRSQSRNVQQPHHHHNATSAPPRKEPTVESTQYLQFVEICKTLFPDVTLPDMRQVYKRFLEFKEQLHHLQIVRYWLEQKGRVHLRPVGFDVNRETGTLCDMEHCCAEFRKSIPLYTQQFHALRYFLVNSSAFFEVYFTDLTKKRYGDKDIPPGDLEEIVGAVVRDLQQLVEGNLRLSQIRDLQKAAEKNKGSTEEGQIISKFFSEKGDDTLLSHAHFLQEGLVLIQYLEFIPAVVNCCKQFVLCTVTAEKLENVHRNLTSTQVSLQACTEELVNVRQQLGNMEPQQLELFSAISLAGDVLEWHQTFTATEFEQRHALVQGSTQGWKFGQDLALCAVTSRKPMMVFQSLRTPEQSNTPLSELCKALLAEIGNDVNDVPEIIHTIKTVHENLPQIKVMFSRQGSLNLEALLPYISSLREKGCYRSCLHLHPKGESLVLVVPQTGGGPSDQSHSFLMNLIRAMKIFISSSEESDETNVAHFVGLFTLAEQMHQMRLELESMGHPQYQGKEDMLNQPGELMNVDILQASHTLLEQQLAEWKGLMVEVYNRQPRLNFLSGRQLTRFGAALTVVAAEISSVPPQSVTHKVQALVGPYLWACFPDVETIPPETVLQCLESAIVDIGGRPEPEPVPVPVPPPEAVGDDAIAAVVTEGVGAIWNPCSLLKLVCCFVTQVANLKAVQAGTMGATSTTTSDSSQDIVVQLAEGFTPNALLHLLFQIFEFQKPHPSRILYGKNATKSDLKRLLRCINSFPHLTFAIVGVNEMMEELRQKLYKWSSKMAMQDRPQAKTFLIFTSRVGIDVFFNSVVKQQSVVSDEVKAKIPTSSLNPRQIMENAKASVVCYTGGPCTGKSTEIRAKMEQCKQNLEPLCISMTECFSVSDVIPKLSPMLKVVSGAEGTPFVANVHFDISAYADMNVVSTFFYNMLMWSVVWDAETGEMVPLSRENLRWNLFVELAAAPASDALEGFGFESTELVLENIPILSHLGAFVKQCDLPFVVDNSALLVAKFLQAKAKNLLDKPSGLVEELDANPPSFGPAATVLEDFFHSFKPATVSTVSLQSDRMMQHHFVSLLADRCTWLSFHAHQRLELQNNPEEAHNLKGMVLISKLFQMLVEESFLLCNPTLDSEKQVYIARENARRKDAAGLQLPTALALMERPPPGLSLPNDMIFTLAMAKNPGLLRQQLQLAFGMENLLEIIEREKYILTPDFALKMLLVYDHMNAGHNLTLCGGTGTGKTELLNVFSIIINSRAKMMPDLAFKMKKFVLSKMLSGIPAVPPALLAQCEAIWTQCDADRPKRPRTDIPQAPLKIVAPQHTAAKTCLEWLDDNDYFQRFVLDLFNTHNDLLPQLAGGIIQFVKKNLEKRKYIVREGTLLRVMTETPQPDNPGEPWDPNTLADLVKSFRNAKFETVFHRIRMHQRISADEFRSRINKIQESLTRFPKDAKVVCFIDECTSTSLLGMVKEVMCDSRLDGEPLPKNIFFVAALNKNENSAAPPAANRARQNLDVERSSISQQYQFDFVGVPNKSGSKSFAVRPPPLSMEKMTVDFGKLTKQQEESFTRGLISSRLKDYAAVDETCANQFTSLVLFGQDFVNRANIHRVAASIRDIVRAIDLYIYFLQHKQFMCNLPNPSKSNYGTHVHWQAMVA
ncbi:hypothetical protein Pelo_2541 [Pelomyxa schiedti]|nr:hypothetical protein Pelo_2541 [Pelomyxa schiedti]